MKHGNGPRIPLLIEEEILAEESTGSSVESRGDELTNTKILRDIIKKKNTVMTFQQAAQDKWRVRKDQQICATSLACLLLIVVQNVLIWQFAHGGDPDDNGVDVRQEDHPTLFVVVWCMNSAMMLLTVMSLVFLGQYYRASYVTKQQDWMQQMGDGIDEPTGLPPSACKLFTRFAVEVTIQLIYPFPFIPRSSFLYQLLLIGMFFRLYIVLRVLHTSSHAFRRRAQIRSQYQDFRRMNLKISWDLTIKMAFYKYMWAMVSVSTLLIIFVLAFCLYVLEREARDTQGLHSGFSDIGGCLWFSFITFSTIGYGDMVPRTPAGKVVTVLLGVLGHLVIATFGGVVTNKLTPTKTQQLMTEYVENQDAEANYKRAAATLIQSVWRACLARRRAERNIWSSDRESNKIRQRNREQVRQAVKRFMQRRYQLAKSSLQAIDPVVDQKLDLMNNMLEAHGDILNKLVGLLDCASTANPGSPLMSTMQLTRKSGNNLFSGSFGRTNSPSQRRATPFRKGSARRSNSITGFQMAFGDRKPPSPTALLIPGNDVNPSIDITPIPILKTPPSKPASLFEGASSSNKQLLRVDDESFLDALRLHSTETLPVQGVMEEDEEEEEEEVLDPIEDSICATDLLPIAVGRPPEQSGGNPLVLNVAKGPPEVRVATGGLPRSPRMSNSNKKNFGKQPSKVAHQLPTSPLLPPVPLFDVCSLASVNSASSGGTLQAPVRRKSAFVDNPRQSRNFDEL
eukprot:TRINITY_DN6303_c0_g3_i1.p1 TRINITY_DN6303_c0_g3~~TRINITY_DN6303_c0_g3_i1.p1  ORF type:complete len:738 (+),score=84.02 TRINITY_DN6303_c0_g3_i1:68-2281(+)